MMTVMNKVKPIASSLGVQSNTAGIVGAIVALLTIFGVNASEEEVSSVVLGVITIVTAGSMLVTNLVGLYGRIRATHQLK